MNGTMQVQLYGRVIIEGEIRALSGLHIGRGKESISVGGIDNAIIREPISGNPYIPGSSLKGKLRSLAEKATPTAMQNQPVGRDVFMHTCDAPDCPVCRIFGAPAEMAGDAPTRLVVRDIPLTPDSLIKLKASEAGSNLTEIKYEASIDRVTAKANPRPLERVPAESVFGPFQMVFSVYKPADAKLLKKLTHYMELLEEDYLGGSGSRGSGKIQFEKLKIWIKPVSQHGSIKGQKADLEVENIGALLDKLDELVATVEKKILVPQPAQP